MSVTRAAESADVESAPIIRPFHRRLHRLGDQALVCCHNRRELISDAAGSAEAFETRALAKIDSGKAKPAAVLKLAIDAQGVLAITPNVLGGDRRRRRESENSTT